jgi:hypothetical protein
MKGIDSSYPSWSFEKCRNATRNELYVMQNEAKRALQYNTRMRLDTACLIWELRLQNIQEELQQRTAHGKD